MKINKFKLNLFNINTNFLMKERKEREIKKEKKRKKENPHI